MKKTLDNKDILEKKCKICNSYSLRMKYHRIREGHELIPCDVLECVTCGLVFLGIDCKQEELLTYYKEGHFRDKYLPNLKDEESKNADIFFKLKQPLQEKRYEILKDIFNKKMDVLDVGCATAGFLNILKKKVRRVKGIELYLPHVKFVQNTFNIEIEMKDITGLQGEKFDTICIFHVLEHVAEPLDFMKEIFIRIKDKGIVVIEVPNVEDALISIFDVTAYKDFHFMKPHLFYYSNNSLEFLLKKAGFKNIEFRSYQHYGIINHMNWILTGKTASATKISGAGVQIPLTHMEEPKLDVVNEFFEEMNKKYKDFLEAKENADTLLAIAKK